MHVIGIVAVDLQERDLFEKVALQRPAVIHAHEFARDEPSGDAVIGHERVRQTHEVTVEAGQAVDLDATRLFGAALNIGLADRVHVMMPDIRRNADEKVCRLFFRCGSGVVFEPDVERRVTPERA